MKVLHVMPGTAYGGVQAMVLELARGQRAAGLDAQVLTFYSHPEVVHNLEKRGIPYRCVDSQCRWNPRFWKNFAQVIRSVQPDIIHFHWMLVWAMLAIKFCLEKDCPWIYQAHIFPPLSDYVWHDRPGAYPPLKGRIKYGLMKVILKNKFDCIVGVPKRLPRLVAGIMARASRGIAPSTMASIWRCCTPGARKMAGFYGRYSPGTPAYRVWRRLLAQGKGIKEFLEVVPVISRYLPEARFVLAGDGPLLYWARDYCPNHGP